jgi:ammonium transporter, Amt family
VLAGIACPLALSLKTRFGYDDALDVVGVHLVGGLVGTLAIGLFAKGSLTGGVAGLLYGGGFEQLGRQAIGAFAVMAYSGLVTLLIALAIKYTIGLRVSTDDEVSGVDITEHAENGYDFSRVGYSSYRVQQTLVIPAAPVSPVDYEASTDAPVKIKEEVR